jgi:hypothetical protein
MRAMAPPTSAHTAITHTPDASNAMVARQPDASINPVSG